MKEQIELLRRAQQFAANVATTRDGDDWWEFHRLEGASLRDAIHAALSAPTEESMPMVPREYLTETPEEWKARQRNPPIPPNHATLRYEYDPVTDVATIEGIRYSGDLFRGLGIAPIGRTLRIVNREGGVATVRRLEPGSTVPTETAP